MSITLTDLVTQLKETIKPSAPTASSSQGNPTDAQYASAVKEAVLDYARRVGVRLLTTIQVTRGTASYALPDDFVRLSDFPDLKRLAQSRVLFTGEGIIPMAGAWVRERYAVRNKQLTISPTPTYSMARPLWYVAGFPLASDAYADLTDEDVATLMHKATELILMQLADGVARQGWSYSVGDESVNKTTLAQTLRDQATAERALYDTALASALSGGAAVGSRATYSASEAGSFGDA